MKERIEGTSVGLLEGSRLTFGGLGPDHVSSFVTLAVSNGAGSKTEKNHRGPCRLEDSREPTLRQKLPWWRSVRSETQIARHWMRQTSDHMQKWTCEETTRALETR